MESDAVFELIDDRNAGRKAGEMKWVKVEHRLRVAGD